MLAVQVMMLGQLFRRPMDIPTESLSLLWALPICLSIALVYKAVKLNKFRPAVVVREVALLFGTIVGFLVLVAACLYVVAQLVR